MPENQIEESRDRPVRGGLSDICPRFVGRCGVYLSISSARLLSVVTSVDTEGWKKASAALLWSVDRTNDSVSSAGFLEGLDLLHGGVGVLLFLLRSHCSKWLD